MEAQHGALHFETMQNDCYLVALFESMFVIVDTYSKSNAPFSSEMEILLLVSNYHHHRLCFVFDCDY